MKLLVAIKGVPAVAGRISLTDDERAIDVRYLGQTIGPHEECAVEEAVRLIEAHGGESVVVTLGPADAVDRLRESMALGIARAIHLRTDGSEWDPESTAAALVEAIRADEAESGPFDLILMGNEAGDTADFQVAVRVGWTLGRPVVTRTKALVVDGGRVRCEQEVDGGRDVYEVPLPAIVGVLEGINLPRYPSVPGRLRARSKPVVTTDPVRPPQRLEMRRLVVPASTAKGAEILGTGPEAAPAVVDVLKSLGVL